MITLVLCASIAIVAVTEIGPKATVAATAATLSSKEALTTTSYRMIIVARHVFSDLIGLTDISIKDAVHAMFMLPFSLTFVAAVFFSFEALTATSYRIVVLVLHASIALITLTNIGVKASVAAAATTSSSLASAATTSSSSEALPATSTAIATSASLCRTPRAASASVIAACPCVTTGRFLRRVLLLSSAVASLLCRCAECWEVLLARMFPGVLTVRETRLVFVLARHLLVDS